MKSFQIGTRNIGGDNPCFIIAELSANHNGSLDTALATIKAAKRAGADAVKLQTFRADTITIDSKKEDFRIGGTIWDGQFLYDLYLEAFTPWEWHEQLFKTANEEGLICFSSPFDPTSVDLLESLNTPAYKVASLEITDIPLIELIASKGKPVIISTGIATREDIELAIDACKRMGNTDIALLKCTTSYPAPIEEANLSMVKDFENSFEVITGLSDHTMGSVAPIVSVVMGAKIIEKHFILDRSIGGPDASFSMNEEEFTEMVNSVRDAEKSIGIVNYDLTEKQSKGKIFARSLYVIEDIEAGGAITEKNVRSIRPGYGMHPKYYKEVLGKKSKSFLEKGTPLTFNDIL
ncbi:MAG: pseudaminic acid synthase [Mucilaginibacter sp.]